MISPGGTVTCDRCGQTLDGYGVLTGLILNSIVNGQWVDRILCYGNGCRNHVFGSITVETPDNECDRCGNVLPSRSVANAMLGTDIDPTAGGVQQRFSTFCHANGCSTIVLNRVGI